MKITKLILTLLLINHGIYCQNNSFISDIAKENLYSFTYHQSFQGKGWSKIIQIAKKHKYLLIGEDHGTAEIPNFILELIKLINFDLFVTEIDSITALTSKQAAISNTTEIDGFHLKNPSALSFFSAKEEFELLTHLVKTNADIWGLDQVSLFSTGLILRKLKDISKSNKAKKLAFDLAKLSDELFIKATKSGNYDSLFIFSSGKEMFSNLKTVFKNESSATKTIINEIEMSWQIYNNNKKLNHFTRIKRMKEKLLNYYNNQIVNGKQYKKVLYKFGANHVGKAQSPLGGFDVGNFVYNIADAEGDSSYHLMIIGKKGVTNTFLPTENLQTIKFDIEKQESELSSLNLFAKLAGDEDWGYFDLVPIRKELEKGKINIDDSFLKSVIYGYDGLIIIPEVTPSTIIKK